MKKLSILSAILGLAFVGTASAADVTVYHSPTCPHCHHAREFISNTLIYEYPTITVTEVNVMEPDNRPKFQEALKKCEYESGGVPVLVIGEKCFQGYADFMQDNLRTAVEVGLTDAELNEVSANKKALSEDAEKFKSEHADRANAIVEYSAAAVAAQEAAELQKKSEGGSVIWFWGLLVILVAGLGYVLVRKDKKK